MVCYLAHAAKKARQPTGKYLRLKYNAKKMGVPLDITKEEYLLYQDLDCHYCGLPVAGRSSVEARDNTGSGLDRKLAGGGYTKDNVVPACFLCNRTKKRLVHL